MYLQLQESPNRRNLIVMSRRAGSGRAARDAAVMEAIAPFLNFASPFLGDHSQAGRRMTALLGALELLPRLAKSKRKWFYVLRRPDGLILDGTQDGKNLVCYLNDLGGDIWPNNNYEKRVHPHLRLLFEVACEMLVHYRGWETTGWALGDFLCRNAVQSEVLLNELVQRLRVHFNNPTMVRRVENHDHGDLLNQNELQKYFTSVAKKFPKAIVLRCELMHSSRATQPGSLVSAEHARALSTAWLDEMKLTHSDALVGLAFRMAYDNMHGWHDHILLIMNGPTDAAHREIMSAAGQLWRDVAGLEAVFVDCKGPDLNLTYRGRRLGSDGGSLAGELIDASFFLTRVDHLVAYDLHDNPIMKGYGKFPNVKPRRVGRTWDRYS